MPIDPWIARGGVPLEVDNTLARIGALKQRDQMLQQDAQQNAFMQQRFGAAQAQAADDDAEWDQAYAARDWGTMAKLDPQATKAIYEFEQAQQPQEPLQQPVLAQQGDYSYLFDPQKGVVPGSVQTPQRAPQQSYAPTADERDFSRYESMSPEQRSLYERMKGRAVNDGDSKPMSAKDANTARVKLTQVAVARRQLQDAQVKYAALKDTLSAGPGGNLIPSPKGKAYDAAIDTMRSSISALTRVPGIGAMSDFETRLDQAKFPSRGNYEQVGEQQLQALADQLNTIESSYREMLGGTSKPSAAPAAEQSKKAAPNVGDNVKGYIFIGGDPKERKNWVKSR